MKRKFTLLAAVLMLLSCLAVPLGMWGQTPSAGTFIIDFYDATKLTSTSGTGLTNSNYSSFVKVPTGLTPTDVVTGVSVTGTVQYGKNGGLTAGTGTAANANTHYVTFNIGSDYAVTKCTVYATYYDTPGRWRLNNFDADSGSLGDKGATIDNVTDPLIWDDLEDLTALTFKKDNGSGGNQKRLTIYRIICEYSTGGGSSYTITAVSNDDDYGTVDLSGTTITATPNSGYRVIAGNGGYTVTAGTATVINNGDNTFSVTPESDCTVQINFEAIPTHTATFSVNGTTSTQTFAEGAAITFPDNPADIGNKTFVGWVTTAIPSTTNTAPEFVDTTTATMGNDDVTFYAVFATADASGAPEETKTQTLEYDTWTYVGNNTSDQNTYRLFGDGSYVVSDAFDLSKLSKVIVYGGTYGGDSYNSLTIGDGDNIWISGTVSGKVATNPNTFTSETTLTGTKVLRVTSTCGNGSSNGIRMSKVEIFTLEPSIVYSNYCTTVLYVATPTFSPAGGTFQEAQSVTIACTTDGATIQYKLTENGEWQDYSAAIPVSTTTTIWAKATKEGMDDSEVASATYTIQYTLTVDINDVVEYFLYDYTNETWDEITIDNEGHALVASGADVRISGGEVYDDCYEVESFDVTDGNDDPVTVVDYTEEDGTYSFIMPASNATLSATVNEIADHYILTVEGLGHVSIEMLVGPMSKITTLNAYHQASICEGSEVTISELTVGNGFALQSVQLDGEELTKTDGVYTFEMPSNNATLTFTTVSHNAPYYMLHTGALEEGDYLIVYNNGAMNNTESGNRLQYETITVNDNTIITDNDAIVWHIAPSGEYWTIYSEDVSKYAAGTSSKNQATLLDNVTNFALWTVVVNDNTYDFENYGRSQGSDPNNKYLRKNGTYGFACYASGTGGALSLYKKVTPSNYTVEIEPNKWHFIASPTGTAPTNVDDLTDLYYYEEQDHFWRNEKVFANANGFLNFDLGKGYLCANAGESVTDPVTLTFTGVANTADSYSVDLDYNATTTEDETNTLAGWNLVGNPFGGNATLNMDCYIISGTAINTTAQTAGTYTVAPCEGVMVKATEAGQKVTFTKVTTGETPQPNQLQLTVAQQVITRSGVNSMVNDNAIINFNAGSRLEKFAFNADAAKLYIPQNGKEYAVVSTEAQGEMSVNFKATENGTYTLTVNPEGVEMNYLHLIDNMTGNDIDLLCTPSYSFNATTNDFESRFRLVFAAANNEDGASTGSASFAFMSDGNWIINNASEATLQVIDLNGRILSSERVNGSVSKTINATPGVYMLRLINGENVMVQKIVVR